MITEDIANDPRLSPIFDEDTKLLFQLIVLEINVKSTGEKSYQVVYGWCLKTTRKDISDTLYSSNFKELFTNDDIRCSVCKLSYYNHSSNVIKFTNALFEGEAVQEAAGSNGINIDKLRFDFSLQSENLKLRPIIFNEPAVPVTRNFYEKNSLTSPYKSVPSFSLIIYNLGKIEIFRNGANQYYTGWQEALLSILQFLKKETSLPFTTTGCTRFGNIEFINTQCSDEYEVYNVSLNNIKETIKVNQRDCHSCKEVVVTIKHNSHTENRELLINCYLTNGGQVVLDECKSVVHNNATKDLEISFKSNEPLSQIAVSIWRKENGKFQIWYKNAYPIIRELQTNIGMVGISGIVKSEWLKKIEDSNSKTRKQVQKAQEISRASYSKVMIGGYQLDPWVQADKDFSALVYQLLPEKSNAEFFSRGWNSDDNEHGALSFLEWFKKITSRSKKVVLIDPFFDTLGLEFLSRTTNSDTEFSIISCTQIMSLDDDKERKKGFWDFLKRKKKIKEQPELQEPNRALRLKGFIKSYPSIFQNLNLNIADLRSTGGGNKNIIHDRYLLIFESDTLSSGFHLSNSIQGATQYHPLLITPIPKDTLIKVDSYISDLIDRSGNADTVNIVTIYNSKDQNVSSSKKDGSFRINKSLFDELTASIKSEQDIDAVLSKFVDKMNKKNGAEFNKYWAALAHFMANTSLSHLIMDFLIQSFSDKHLVHIRHYVESSVTEPQKTGHDYQDRYVQNNFYFVFQDSFKDGLKECLRIEPYLFRTECYSNWGVYYGTKLLSKQRPDEFISLVDFIQTRLDEMPEGMDISNTPILKLVSVAYGRLAKELFSHGTSVNLTEYLNSSHQSIKIIAASALVSLIVEGKIKMNVAEKLIASFSFEEKAAFYLHCLFNLSLKKEENVQLENSLYDILTSLIESNYSRSNLTLIFDELKTSRVDSIEKKITEQILLTLFDKKIIPLNDIVDLWVQEFFDLLSVDRKGICSGVVDITGWSFHHADTDKKNEVLGKLEKEFKAQQNEIWKPLRKGTTEWEEAFENILLIRTFSIISILYNDKNVTEPPYQKLVEIIDTVNDLEKSYKPVLSDAYITQFSTEILEKYQTS